MGRIYRAVQRPVDRLVALKVLNPRFDGTKDPNFEERFFYEALTTAKLKHPNTVTLYDYGRSEGGLYYMALELIEGLTLQQTLVKGGPLAWPRALSIAAQIARSLREAHGLGLVHRDLKPANIMLVPEGLMGDRVKVLDFGLVKAVAGLTDAARDEGVGDRTEAGVVLGSPLYMAPEQARKAVDPRSDLYSLGAVLFAAIAGRPPFLGKNAFDLMLKHMHERPPDLSELAEIPEVVHRLVMKCLEKEPEARFQSADQLLSAIHHVVSSQGFGGLYVAPAVVFVEPMASARAGLPELRASAPAPAPSPVSVARPAPCPVTRPATPSSPPTPPMLRRVPHRRPPRRWRWFFSWTVVCGLASTALGAALVVAREVSSPATSAPREARFQVTSVPSGATVLQGPEVVGRTPLEVVATAEAGSPPRVQLALVLDGYETAVLAAEADRGDAPVPVHQVLVRRLRVPVVHLRGSAPP